MFPQKKSSKCQHVFLININIKNKEIIKENNNNKKKRKERKRNKMLFLLVHYIMNQIRRLSIKMHGVLSCPAQEVGIYKRKKESKKKRKRISYRSRNRPRK